MKFIGREKEISAIEYLLSSDGFKSCVLYGRRRLGKTELIKHCLCNKEVPCIIFQCLQDNEKNNISGLAKEICEQLGFFNLSFASFVDAIEFVFKEAIKRKIYFAIDEYPYIREIIPGIDSYLQNLIDKYQKDANLKFFILGSSVSTMEDIQSSHAPLYRRFNQSILLTQMDYLDASKFYESFSNEDKIRLYSAFGGVPFYNAQIDSKQSVKENIIRLLSGSLASFVDDYQTYLREELRKINNANIVFNTIALGAYHYSDILSKSKINSSPVLNDVLKKLNSMDLIANVSPINDSNRQKAGYIISDNSLRFYFKYIYRFASQRAILDDDIFFDTFIKDDFESSFVPKCFEDISKQFLIRKNKKGELNPMLTGIGNYWYDDVVNKTNGQFDVVGKTSNGYIFFECKFKNTPINDQIIKQEIEQVNRTSMKVIQYGFISKSGFDLNESYPYLFYTLNDFFNII